MGSLSRNFNRLSLKRVILSSLLKLQAPGEPEGTAVSRRAADNGPDVKGFLLPELDLFAQFLLLMYLIDLDLLRLVHLFRLVTVASCRVNFAPFFSLRFK